MSRHLGPPLLVCKHIAEDPKFPASSLFAADGMVTLGFVPAEIGVGSNVLFPGSPMGFREPDDEWTGP